MSIYKKENILQTQMMSFAQTEKSIYGSSRLGTEKTFTEMIAAPPVNTTTYKRVLGNKNYELVNHLGNVLSVVSDRKFAVSTNGTTIDFYKADITSVTDYYPFGSPMKERNFTSEKYRYGFNGQEKTDEISGFGNHNTAMFWEYDTRLGRRWNLDPVIKPWESGYAAFANNPIWFGDPNGRDTTFSDKQSQKDFNKAYNMTKNKIGDANKTIAEAQDKLKNGNWFQRIGQKDKLANAQADLAGLTKIEDDFKYIVDPTTPEITYSTDVTKLASDEDGKSTPIKTTNTETCKITMSYNVVFRTGKYSTIVHENRHTRQPCSMFTYQKELEAHTYQRVFSYSDVQNKIEIMIHNQYTNNRLEVPYKYGLPEYIRDVYNVQIEK